MRYLTRRAGRRDPRARLPAAAFAALCMLVLVPGGVAGAVPGASAVLPSPASRAAAGDLQLALPAPTGRWPIGVRSDFVADPSRRDPTTGGPRTLPVRVWYPARAAGTGPPARYLSPAVQPVVEQSASLPAGTLDVSTYASTDAAMRRRVRGVILVSPGFGGLVAFSTGQVIDLASRGWVVVTFDHPHDAPVVEQPDGTLIFSDLGSEPDIERFFAERVADVGVVLRDLRRLVPEARRRVPVGMFGHSLGGAAAAEALLRYPPLRAGVDLDGTPFGRVVHEGLDEPLGIMLSADHQPGPDDPNLEQLIANLRGPHRVEQLDIGHNGFTDLVVFIPQITLANPALGAALEADIGTGVDTIAEGTTALETQRRFLRTFMRRHLRRCHEGAERSPLPAQDAAHVAGERFEANRSRCSVLSR